MGTSPAQFWPSHVNSSGEKSLKIYMGAMVFCYIVDITELTIKRYCVHVFFVSICDVKQNLHP